MKAPDYFYDGQMLPFNGRSFDGVINTQVLEHAPNARSMLLEMNRVIKLGGLVISFQLLCFGRNMKSLMTLPDLPALYY